MKYVLVGLLLALSIISISCEKKKSSSSTTPGTVYPNGMGAGSIYGYVTINASCGATVATVQLYGYNTNQVMYSVQVTNGGTYQFQATAGNYTLVATAGNNCYVSGPVQSSSTRAMGYDLNIANYNNYYGKVSDNDGNCALSTYGCSGSYYGSGTVISSPNIYLSGVENEKVSVKLKPAQGNNLLVASPIHSSEGWQTTVSGNKVMMSEVDTQGGKHSATYDSLYYNAQLDENLLQSDTGVCVKADKVIDSMKEQLEILGFRSNVVQDLVETSQKKLPKLNGDVCIYPQDSSTVDKSISLEVNKPYRSKRVWFILVPQEASQARFAKPKNNAIAALKKQAATRNVAQSELLIEEWGMGFLIEKNTK